MLPQQGQRMVRGDPQQPGAEPRCFAEFVQVLDHAQEGLLGHLLGVLVLLDDPAGDAIHLPLVFHQQRLHGREVAGLGPLDERLVLVGLPLPLLPQHAAQSLVERGRQVELLPAL